MFNKIAFATLFMGLFFFTAFKASNNNTNKKDDVTMIKITTDFGEMTAKLYNETPKHRDNFIKLAKAGEYDGTIFHRVINAFMMLSLIHI